MKKHRKPKTTKQIILGELFSFGDLAIKETVSMADCALGIAPLRKSSYKKRRKLRNKARYY